MLKTLRLVPACAAAAVILVTATAVTADPAVRDYRKNTYAAIGGHMKAAVAIIKGEVAFADDLAMHGQALADLARTTLHVFPEGSGDGDTRALPAIWQKPDEFKKVQADFVASAAAFAEAAKQGPAAAAGPVGELGKACKACHDNFRAEK